MAVASHLNKPPITEALFDVKAILPKNVNIETLLQAHEKEKAKYPIREVKAKWEASFQFKPGEAAIVNQKGGTPQGYMMFSSDRKKIFQARLDGFTYNQLATYESWDKFAGEAYRLLDIYMKIAKPISITRLALRFINKIEIPLPISDITEYLNTIPHGIVTMGGKKIKYFMNLLMNDKDTNNESIFTNVIEEPASSNIIRIIIDIDTYRSVELKSEDQIDKIILSLREYKNKIFFNTITDKTKQLFT